MTTEPLTLTRDPDPFDAADCYGTEGQDMLDDSPAEAVLHGVVGSEDEPSTVLELRAFVDEVSPVRVLAYKRRDPAALLARLTNYVNDEWWDEMEHDEAAEMSGKDHGKSEAKIAELLAEFAAFMGEPTRCDEVASRTYGSEELFDLLRAHYGSELDEESET